MDIQYISNQKAKIQNIECSTIDSPKSFDTFDINIIDFNSSEIWQNNNDNTRWINEINDFKNIFSEYLGINAISLSYENNETLTENLKIKSSFYFSDHSFEVLTKSIGSNKDTTIKYNEENLIVTTLHISNYDEIISFLKELRLIDSINDFPEWVKEYTFYDDASLKESNKEIDGKIEQLQLEKNKNISLIEKNNYYKSILISSGDDLVKTVFDILFINLSYDKFTTFFSLNTPSV